MKAGEAFLPGTETKIFDPGDPVTGSGGAAFSDATVVRRQNQWWLYLAGQAKGHGPPGIYSASLPPAAPLSASGWKVTRDAAGEPVPAAGGGASRLWDSGGGRHCPAYVKGRDPATGNWVERIYYAGAADRPWGPYTIGFLQWQDSQWVDQQGPAFAANEEWEHGSVFEPNLIYHDGKWKMWYVAGSNQEDYHVHGYAESDDGCTHWSKHTVFAPPQMKMFDFCVRQRGASFDAIYSRVWMGRGERPAETGLWWCRAGKPSSRLEDWEKPTQIMTAEDRGWRSGPWKPTFEFESESDRRAWIFFDGIYPTGAPGPFPFAFTLGCLELRFPV